MENKELLYGYLVNNFKNKNFSEYTCENIMNGLSMERGRDNYYVALHYQRKDLEKLNSEFFL